MNFEILDEPFKFVPGTDLFRSRLVWLNKQLRKNPPQPITPAERKAFKEERKMMISYEEEYKAKSKVNEKRERHRDDLRDAMSQWDDSAEEEYVAKRMKYPDAGSWVEEPVPSFRVPSLSSWKRNFTSFYWSAIIRDLSIKHNVLLSKLEPWVEYATGAMNPNARPFAKSEERLRGGLHYWKKRLEDPLMDEEKKKEAAAIVEFFEILIRRRKFPSNNNNNLNMDVD